MFFYYENTKGKGLIRLRARCTNKEFIRTPYLRVKSDAKNEIKKLGAQWFVASY